MVMLVACLLSIRNSVSSGQCRARRHASGTRAESGSATITRLQLHAKVHGATRLIGNRPSTSSRSAALAVVVDPRRPSACQSKPELAVGLLRPAVRGVMASARHLTGAGLVSPGHVATCRIKSPTRV